MTTFPRKRESSITRPRHWIPAFAGMTERRPSTGRAAECQAGPAHCHRHFFSGILFFMPVTVRHLVRQLEEDGWIEVRQRGSHRQFRHPTKSGTVTVSGKPSADLPPGTLNSVLKQAGLKNQRNEKKEGEA